MNSRPSTPAYWIFLPGLAVSVFILLSSLRAIHGALPHPPGYRWVASLPLAVLLVTVAGPASRIANRNRVASLCAVLTLAFYWAVVSYFFFGVTAKSVYPLLFLWPWMLLLLIVAVAPTISCGRRLDLAWVIGGAVVGVLCGAIAVESLIAAKEAERNWPRPLDPTVLAPEVTTFTACAQTFASSHPDKGYPQSLAQLGSQGTRCLPDALLASQYKGFTFVYQPGAKDAFGKITEYRAAANETVPKGPDVASMFTDQSGLIRYRYDGPHGKGSTNTLFPYQYPFQRLLDCLWTSTSTPGPWRILSDRLYVISDRDEYIRRVLGEQFFPRERTFSQVGYDFEYSLTTAIDGSCTGFTITARPQHYGVSGIRSFLAVAAIAKSPPYHTLNVYVTPGDRPATTDDDLAQASEIGMSGIGPLATFSK